MRRLILVIIPQCLDNAGPSDVLGFLQQMMDCQNSNDLTKSIVKQYKGCDSLLNSCLICSLSYLDVVMLLKHRGRIY